MLQDPSYVPGPEMVPGAKTSHFFPDVAAAALEVLRQQVPTEELKRYLRKLHDRQINPAQAELVTFELVYLLAERVRMLPCHYFQSRIAQAKVTHYNPQHYSP